MKKCQAGARGHELREGSQANPRKGKQGRRDRRSYDSEFCDDNEYKRKREQKDEGAKVARIKQTTQVQAIAKNETLAGFNYSPVT